MERSFATHLCCRQGAREGGLKEVTDVCQDSANCLNEAAHRIRWQVAMHGHLLSQQEREQLGQASQAAEDLYHDLNRLWATVGK